MPDAPVHDPGAGLLSEPQAPPLDEVMLAMDVVDTLRHQQDLVQAELDEEARDARLVRRVQEIYESQGIEVPASVVREGVEALKQDRFRYRPVRRTLAIRLAEVYATRGWWFPRLVLVVALVLLVWGAVAWSRGRQARRDAEAFAARAAAVGADVRALEDALSALDRRLDGLSRREDLPPAARGLLEGVRALHASARTEAEDLPPLPPDAARAWREAPVRQDRALAAAASGVADLRETVGRVEGRMEAVEALLDVRGRLATVLDSFTVEPEDPEDRREIDRLGREAQAALEAGDAASARPLVDRLVALRELLLSAYELRIVSEPATPSGVRRAPPGETVARNHYIVVDAVGRDGRPVAIRVVDEEDQRAVRTTRFAVRVPREVYEAVKRDKEDNGIVDDRLFGVKRAGAREPEWRFEVAGGMLTKW